MAKPADTHFDSRALELDTVLERLAALCRLPQAREMAAGLAIGTDPQAVDEAQAETAEAIELLQQGRLPRLGALADPREVLRRVALEGVLSGEDLIGLADFLATAFSLVRAVRFKRALAPRLGGAIPDFGELEGLINAIRKVVADNGDVKDGASILLARLRGEAAELYQSLHAKLTRLVAQEPLATLLQSNHIVSRNNRLTVEVKIEFRHRVEGIVQDFSASGATAFVEPLVVVEPCNRWREMEGRVLREEMRILEEMSLTVLGHLRELNLFHDLTARLDLALSKGALAIAMNATRPRRPAGRAGPRLHLPQARHPLLGDGVVPSTITLPRGVRGLVVSGPNAGGKTVTLKTAGLLALMHQAGLHLPTAEGAVLPVFNAVHADIGDGQSIESSVSTFSAKLDKVRAIMDGAGSKMLVLLDEVGASTSPAEGAALASAIIGRLCARGAHLVATTHYRAVMEHAAASDLLENGSMSFDADNLTPTYELIIGLPGRSHALELARRVGLPSDLIDEAAELAGTSTLQSEKLLADIQRRSDELRGATEELQERLDDLDRQRQAEEGKAAAAAGELVALRERMRAALQREVQQIKNSLNRVVRQAKRDSSREAAARALARISGEVSEPTWGAITEAENLVDDELLEAGAAPIAGVEELKRGDWVVVRDLNRRAQVVDIRASGEVELLMGKAKIQAQPHQLSRIAGG